MFYQITLFIYIFGHGCLAFPAKVPSTSLNLPIDEALAKGTGGEIVDTPRDRSFVEPTFKDPKATDFIHTTLAKVLQPQPLLDTIREEEKYGNTGDQLLVLNTAIVKGTEKATQFVGTAVSLPGKVFTSLANQVTSKLNTFGSYLIGL